MTPTRFYRLPSADRSAILALQEIEDGVCGCGCGQPIEQAWADDGPEYRVKSVTCRARQALDDATDGDRSEPGVMHYVVPDVTTEADLDAERTAEAEALAALKANREEAPA